MRAAVKAAYLHKIESLSDKPLAINRHRRAYPVATHARHR
jgi:hypothetical protein